MNRSCETTSLMLPILCVAGFICGGSAAWAQAAPDGERRWFDALRAKAEKLAGEADREGDSPQVPDFLKNLSYDQYYQIDFRPDRTFWKDDAVRFGVHLFHPGYLYNVPVRIHLIDGEHSRPVPFSRDYFDYGSMDFEEPFPENLAFAGVRLLYPLHRSPQLDEVAVFLGMSYYRLLGAQQIFGASLRGLAIDTAVPSGEEFPRFTEFHVEKPGESADHVRVFALLESRRVTGAYEFVIRPGEATIAEVRASLFFRESVAKVGLAPLTSMFLFGENRTRYFADFRPEVHDSDGLLVETRDGQWLWRPLMNPEKVHRVTSFPNAAAFGLLQRDRDFDHYQDLEALSHRRPSYWVELRDDWGPGRVELIEIPTEEERNDNIVAFWVPEEKIPPKQEFQVRYAVTALRSMPNKPPPDLWRVRDTRLEPAKEHTRFVIEFSGGSAALATSRAGLVPRVRASSGRIGHLNAQPNNATGGVRVVLDFLPEGNDPVEMEMRLERDGAPASEKWVYTFIRP